jgi:hypothetical protein
VNTTGQQAEQADAKPAIVLVHGAFADASSWNGVIARRSSPPTCRRRPRR